MLHITSEPQRLRWLYVSNIIGAGIPGLIMVSFPQWATNNMFPGEHNPAMFGMTGSIWLAIGIASVLGLRTPQLFKSLFVMQIIYKTIWILTVALPLLLQGNIDVLPMALFFALTVWCKMKRPLGLGFRSSCCCLSCNMATPNDRP